MSGIKKMKMGVRVIPVLMIFIVSGCAFVSHDKKAAEIKEQNTSFIEYQVQTRVEKSLEPTALLPEKANVSDGAVNENVVVVAERVLNKDSVMLKKSRVQTLGQDKFSPWQLICDEGGDTYEQSSPNPLSYLTTGIASNLLTQLHALP